MRLQRIRQTLAPARLRLTLSGDLKATLDLYATYYAEHYGETVSLDALIPQILTAFVSNDREFRQWQHQVSNDALPRLPHTPALLRQTEEQDKTETLPNGHSRAGTDKESKSAVQ